jgi:acylphosphatase
MEKSEGRVRVHLQIEGRVQGVFFRASVQEQAIRLGLKGWVRNCPDGSVEVMAEGERKKVEDMVAWCHRGPPGAQVREVQVNWQEFKGEFSAFRITR